MSHADPPTEPPADRAPSSLRRGLVSVLVFVAVIAGLHVLVRATGVSDSLSVTALREAMQQAGGWGPVVYVVGYCLAYVLGTPGLPFVALGVAFWGQAVGGGLAFVGSLAATSSAFWVGRRVGGQSLSRIPWRFVRENVQRLEQGSIGWLALARAVFILPPWLDYALGMTTVSYRRYLLASTLGLVPPLVASVLLVESLIRWFGL